MRDVLILLVWRHSRKPLREIGRHFHVGRTAVTNARTRAESFLQTSPAIRRKIALAASSPPMPADGVEPSNDK